MVAAPPTQDGPKKLQCCCICYLRCLLGLLNSLGFGSPRPCSQRRLDVPGIFFRRGGVDIFRGGVSSTSRRTRLYLTFPPPRRLPSFLVSRRVACRCRLHGTPVQPQQAGGRQASGANRTATVRPCSGDRPDRVGNKQEQQYWVWGGTSYVVKSCVHGVKERLAFRGRGRGATACGWVSRKASFVCVHVA